MKQFRKILLVLVLLTLCAALPASLCAQAEGTFDMSYVTFELSYADENGDICTVYPVPVSYDGYDGCWWVSVPEGALSGGLTLSISDDIGTIASFSPASGDVIYPTDAGSTLTETAPTLIQCYDANGQLIYTISLYVSTVTDEPETPQDTAAAIEPQTVTVYFRTLDNGDMMDVASAQEVTVEAGTHPVTAEPADLMDGYEPAGDSVQYVTVDELGANPYEITFYYTYVGKQSAGEDVWVAVHYTDESGNPVAADDSVYCAFGRITDVYANPADLADGYEPISASVQQVTVTEDGASPAEVTFYYRYVPEETEAPATAEPAPKIAFVTVLYVDEESDAEFADEVFTVQEGMTYLSPNENYLEDGYAFVDASPVSVYVDENGAASPEVVTFYMRRQQAETAAPQPVGATVAVYYIAPAENRQVASITYQDCAEGENLVYAAPVDLESGYDQMDASPVTVTLSADGTLSPGTVVFYYQKNEEEQTTQGDDGKTDTQTETEKVTEPENTGDAYTSVSMSGWGYPRANDVNFRSTPEMEDGNIIGKVDKSDLVQIFALLTAADGTEWYQVSVNGQTGYLKGSFVRVLTEAEENALFGTTEPAPDASTNTPAVVTAAPTEVPDGVIIDSWGEVSSKSVYFRSSRKASGSNKIKSLSRGTMVWVYDVSTVDDTRWYSVRVNGKDGYIVADYVTLYDEAQSEAYQSSLSTPMPTQTAIPTDTPAPTRVPTATPTATPTFTPFVATNTPTPTIAATDVPAAYVGYALTTARAAVRSGISQMDDTIIETVEQNTLVLISAQTYVSGVCWDSVRVLSSGSTGFMEDARLRRINSEEAKYYLDLFTPSGTDTPTPSVTETPFQGYARTLGDNVPMRIYMDTNARILRLLDYDTPVYVFDQQTVNGEAWCEVQYGSTYGYIRRDMLRQMEGWEVTDYLESLSTPTPTPETTVITGETESSYGYVSSNRVNLRKSATKSSESLRLMSKYDFGLVLGETANSEGLWYNVLINGQEGYVLSDYFKVLSLNELSDFLLSEEYRTASGQDSSVTNVTAQPIQSVEDYNQGIWTNPALNATYEPFNPYATATPDPADVVTATPSPTPSATPTPTMPPIFVTTPAPNSTGGSFPTALVVFVVVMLLAAGGAYAYSVYRRNRRRQAALRAQQARRAQQMQMNPQQNRTYPANAARPNGNQQRTAGSPSQNGGFSSQLTQRYSPNSTQQGGSAYRPTVSQETGTYFKRSSQQPVQQQTQNAWQQQNTTRYQPTLTDNGAYPSSQNQSGYARPQTRQTLRHTPVEPSGNPYTQPGQTVSSASAAASAAHAATDAGASGTSASADKATQASTTRRRRTERYHHDEK